MSEIDIPAFMKRLQLLICSVMLWFVPLVASAQVVNGTIIVARGDRAIDVFVTVSGDVLQPLTGVDTSFLTRGDGTVDLQSFRVETAPLGDRVFGPVDFVVGGTPVDAEAISLMMHLKDDGVAFATPWDAITAVTLCLATFDTPYPAIADTQSYLGYSIYPVDGMASLAIELPATGRDILRFAVLEYAHGNLLSRNVVSVADGAVLSLTAVSGLWGWAGASLYSILALLITAILAAATLVHLIQTQRSPIFSD